MLSSRMPAHEVCEVVQLVVNPPQSLGTVVVAPASQVLLAGDRPITLPVARVLPKPRQGGRASGSWATLARRHTGLKLLNCLQLTRNGTRADLYAKLITSAPLPFSSFPEALLENVLQNKTLQKNFFLN